MKTVVLIFLAISLGFIGHTQDVNQKDAQGRKQGKWVETWEKSTIKRYQGQFKNDQPYGKFVFWYEGGKPRALMYYDEGGKVSRVTYFHENGKLMAQGKYINKEKDSTWSYYDNQEHLSYTETYINGNLSGERIVYYLNAGSLGSTYTPNKVIKKEFYKNGILHGDFEMFYHTGLIKQKGTYVDGNLEGQVTHYYPNGRREKIETYKYAVKHGLFMLFDQDGTVQGKLFYKEGRLLKDKELEAYLKNEKKG